MGTNKGKRKIEIKEIKNKAQKQVSFSKRKKGLFKKAKELCVLTNAQAAIVTISGAGRVFSDGVPTADAVIHRHLNNHINDHSEPDHHHDYRDRSDKHWWEQPIGDDLGLVELEQLKVALEDLRHLVASKINRSRNFSILTPQDYDLDLGSIDWKCVPQAFGYAPMNDDVSPLFEQDAMLDSLLLKN